MYCRLISDAVLGGIQQSVVKSGRDTSAQENAGEVLSKEAIDLASEGKEEADNAQNKKRGGRKESAPVPKKAPTVMVKKTPGKK
jgi:hypothetical protein